MNQFEKAFTKVSEAIALYVCGALIFISILYVSANVIARYVFNHSLIGMLDYVGVMLAPITYLSLTYGWYKGANLSIDLITSKLKGKVLWGVEFAFSLGLPLIFTSLLLHSAVIRTIRTYSMKTVIGDAVYYTPLWPWNATLIVGTFSLIIRILLDMVYMVRTGKAIPKTR